jgi:hypothetical protein
MWLVIFLTDTSYHGIRNPGLPGYASDQEAHLIQGLIFYQVVDKWRDKPVDKWCKSC